MYKTVFDKDDEYYKYLNRILEQKNSKYSFEKSEFPLVVLSNDDNKKVFESVNIVIEDEYCKEYESICLVPEDRLENMKKFFKRKKKPLITTVLYRLRERENGYFITSYPILDLTAKEYNELCRLFVSTEIVKKMYSDKKYTWILGPYIKNCEITS